MIFAGALFEAHLTVESLDRSIAFYREVLGHELANVVPERRVAFLWAGGHGQTMLGLWETAGVPQRLSLHVAFRASLADVLAAAGRLRAAGVTPLDFHAAETDEPVVLAWMPAAAVYFRDPDGHLLELIAMLPEAPHSELGVVRWSEWKRPR